MIARFLLAATLLLGWLAAGPGIDPASASALLVAAGPTPFRHSYTCPRTLPMTTDNDRPRTRLARLARACATVIVAIAVVAWVGLLRPTALGGSTTYVVVAGDSMLPTYEAGDLIVAQPIDPSAEESAVGSVVVFRIPAGEPGAGRLVIHRIVGYDAATGYSTRGDHNPYTDPWHPRPADVVGTPAAVLPGAGNAVGFVRQPIVAALLFALLTMAWLFLHRRSQPAPVGPVLERGAVKESSDVGYNPA
jgi:signal peptidase I